MVMTAFNTVDGIPATGNKRLMRDLLRSEWGFDGVLISDWGAVKEMIPHGIAEDEEEAALKAMEAGVDIEMMTSSYVHHLPALVREGRVDESLIDEAVLRILTLKKRLGLFERPTRGADPQAEREIVFCDEHRQAAREAAAKSCVLLKNEALLPLQAEQRVALIGPFAANGDILGPWSWTGSKEDAVTMEQGLRSKLPSGQLTVAEGCGVSTMTGRQLEEAMKAAREADVIVLALGEDSEMSGEAGSRALITLPQPQLELIQHLKTLQKPMVAVLFNGRPLDLHGVLDEVDAVLEAWFPGSEGGAAVAALLMGEANPSGRLSMSFPYSVGQVPVYYNHFNTGRPKDAPDAQVRYVSQYLDIPNEPLLPFGFGLSYTDFKYGDMTLSTDEISPDESLQITVSVTNTGDMAGEEVVQLYIRDRSGEVVRPVKELKAFRKVQLQPGEQQDVTFTLTEEQLRYHHSDLSFTSDAGAFDIMVGKNSRDTETRRFRLRK